jgi:WbqC-like protein family
MSVCSAMTETAAAAGGGGRASMKVGIIQSCYVPWRGFFDFIASVDTFIFLDDVQFTRRDWRTRNQLKTADGPVWISVPVKHSTRGSQTIDQTDILYAADDDWRQRHLNLLRQHYAKARFQAQASQILESAFAFEDATVSELNIRLIKSLCSHLGIRTRLMHSRDLNAEGNKTARLISLLRQVGATHYLSGASADAYLDKAMFADAGIALAYKSYDYAPYPQPWGEFAGQVSVLDLIANCGPESRALIRSRSPDRLVVPPPSYQTTR